MKKAIIAVFIMSVLSLFSLNLYAGRFLVGVELGSMVVDDQTYLGRNTKDIIKNLNGGILSEQNGLFVLGIYEGYQINNYAAVFLRQRYFHTRIVADFYPQPSMNFEFARDIVPLNGGARFRAWVDNVCGFYLEVLPGLYIVDSFEKGYFANYHRRDNYLGVNFSGGVDFIISDIFNISIGIQYDYLTIKRANLILDDGGDGGGPGLVFRSGIVF